MITQNSAIIITTLLLVGCANQQMPQACNKAEEKAAQDRAFSVADKRNNWQKVTIASDQFKTKDINGLVNSRGQIMFEGDIDLGTVAKTHQKGIAILGQSYRWPQGRVPYVIDGDFPNPTWAMDAMNEIHQKAGTISFVPRTTETDYIRFSPGSDPRVGSSPVGRQHGGQTIRVGSQCGTGVTIHETCHSLGLWHEQSYGKRDDYICILWDNIQPGMEFNFGQHLKDGIDVTPFNWNSRMLYFDTAFSKNGQPTIVSKVPGKRIAPDPNHLTPGDVKTLLAIYPAGA
jgi:astacin